MEKNTRKRGFVSYLAPDEGAGVNISWGAIVAGLVSFFAIFITLSLIGSAIGFGIVKPTSDNPLDGVGTGLTIWTVVTFILALFCSGFIAGVAARRIGLLHGFLTWATSVLVLVAILSYTAIGAFSAVGSLFGDIISATGSGIQTAASGTADTIGKSFDKVTENVQSVNTDELQSQVKKVLSDTDVPELQPNYLEDQMKEATNEITDAGKELVKDPENADKIFKDTGNSLKERAKNIGDSVDREAIANAVSANTELSKEEADQATENIYNELQKASDEAQKQIETAQTNLEKAKDDLDETIKEAREKAEDASNTVAKASVWSFIAMVLGMVITSFAGMWGANLVKNPETESKL
ncbi:MULTISPECIES: hypothetical protein [unclassified Enterococcus]|uniref:hypothetical protein n=1 Tax=unclassified Enterococcus TaxID=2608891 RepID=UPI001CE0E230|nr:MULTISPECIES: hypothetical protein [unclassified Enterococcus]MCA5011476.1 hypothetical protein [Enterococcus sp. S23]MCA5015082.1 hypothetical protein [Enterococcus sp. S22(2020)]